MARPGGPFRLGGALKIPPNRGFGFCGSGLVTRRLVEDGGRRVLFLAAGGRRFAAFGVTLGAVNAGLRFGYGTTSGMKSGRRATTLTPTASAGVAPGVATGSTARAGAGDTTGPDKAACRMRGNVWVAAFRTGRLCCTSGTGTAGGNAISSASPSPNRITSENRPGPAAAVLAFGTGNAVRTATGTATVSPAPSAGAGKVIITGRTLAISAA